MRNPKEGAAEALYGLGGAGAARQGDELASLIYLRLALALRPDLDFAAVSVANLLSDMKRGDEAVAAYLNVPKTSPLAESSEIQAAIEYDGLDKTDKGLALMKQVVGRPSRGSRGLERAGHAAAFVEGFRRRGGLL